jgi:large subunit ribosomal protein L25
MSKSEILKAELRKQSGTRKARSLRAEGRIPASLGADGNHPSVHFHIEEHGFLATRRRHTHLYEIEFSGESGSELSMAVVREVQWDTFGESILHLDFKRVQRDVKTESEVELDFVGHPKGGVLNHLITRVTVRCIPTLIPDSIEVLVGHLELGGVVYARELKMPEGVEYIGNKELKVGVVVLAHKIEATPVAAAEGAEGAVAAAAGAVPAAPGAPGAPARGAAGGAAPGATPGAAAPADAGKTPKAPKGPKGG